MDAVRDLRQVVKFETPENVTAVTGTEFGLIYSSFATEAGTQLHDFHLEKGVEE